MMSKISEGGDRLNPGHPLEPPLGSCHSLCFIIPLLRREIHVAPYGPRTGPGPLKGPSRAPLWEPSETQCTRPRARARLTTRIFFRQLFEKLLGYTSEYIVYRDKRLLNSYQCEKVFFLI